jgi:uncharacterized lipoprotein YddW (UPF0748 family)
VALLLPAPLAAAPLPLRDGLGLWFTTVDSAVMFDPQAAAAALDFVQSRGFQRVGIPLYSGGFVTWPLAPERNPLGLRLDPQLSRAEATGQLLAGLGQRGVQRLGWLEFGLMAPPDADWLRGRAELLLQTQEGSTLWAESPGLMRVWLNPVRPEVRQALVDLVVDACTRLPLEAIQLDDHLGYPVRFGYDPTTLALWRQSAAGARQPTPPPNDPDWIAWRADRITDLLVAIRAAMRQACPQVRLSLAPHPQAFAYSEHLADWGRWLKKGLVDEVVVQIYRRDPARVAWELAQPSLQEARRLVPLRVGLLAGLRTQPKATAVLQRELELVQAAGIRGVDLFFYESARRHQLVPPLCPAQPLIGSNCQPPRPSS